MTLRLILTRHAKSSWDNPALDDHDRPLNRRGRSAAAAIGRWLAARGYLPDQVLCSSAERTSETWARIAAELDARPQAAYLPGLYLAEPDEFLAALHGASGKVVMMLGHNPGSAYTARGLVAAPPRHPRFDHYPTAATAVIDFDAAAWGDVTWGQGVLVDFVVPRDLE